MNDQAAALRGLPDRRAWESDGRPGAQVVVVGSGKGGVGKSLVATLLATAWARQGRRVLLVDGAQNQGNLHILLGVRPQFPLAALVEGVATAEQLVVPVTEGLSLIPADSGTETLHALGTMDRARLHHRLSALFDDWDAVVVDAGPGLESAVRAAAMRADRLWIVVVPEPAALADAYALIKLTHLQAPGLPIDVLVNRAASDDEGRAVHERLQSAASRFLSRDVTYGGALPESGAWRDAARTPGAWLSLSSDVIEEVASRCAAAHRAPRDPVPGRES